MDSQSHAHRLAPLLGVSLLLQAFLVQAIAVLLLACGMSLASSATCVAIAASALVGGGALVAWLSPGARPGCDIPALLVTSALSWMACLVAAAGLDDLSWDGQTYHLEVILALRRG